MREWMAAHGAGKTVDEVRADLGIAPRPKAKRATKPKSQGGCSKGEVIDLVNEIRHQLVDLEQVVRRGQRDSAFYARVRGRLTSVRAEVTLAIRTANQIGAPRG